MVGNGFCFETQNANRPAFAAKALFSKEQSAAKSKEGGKYFVVYRGEKFEDPAKSRALVRTKVVVPSENVDISLNYKVKKAGSEWKIYDIIVDEASLIENYKYQFDSIIKKHGYGDLVRRMQAKLERLEVEPALHGVAGLHREAPFDARGAVARQGDHHTLFVEELRHVPGHERAFVRASACGEWRQHDRCLRAHEELRLFPGFRGRVEEHTRMTAELALELFLQEDRRADVLRRPSLDREREVAGEGAQDEIAAGEGAGGSAQARGGAIPGRGAAAIRRSGPRGRRLEAG